MKKLTAISGIFIASLAFSATTAYAADAKAPPQAPVRPKPMISNSSWRRLVSTVTQARFKVWKLRCAVCKLTVRMMTCVSNVSKIWLRNKQKSRSEKLNYAKANSPVQMRTRSKNVRKNSQKPSKSCVQPSRRLPPPAGNNPSNSACLGARPTHVHGQTLSPFY